MMSKTITIHPTKEQKKLLWKLSERCRLIYNFALAERITAWKEEKKKITYYEQQNNLKQTKEKHPQYKSVHPSTLQTILKELDTIFEAFINFQKYDKNRKTPRFKGGKYFTTMVYDQSGFTVQNNKIILKHRHYSEIKLDFDISNPTSNFMYNKIHEVTVYVRNDVFYLRILNV